MYAVTRIFAKRETAKSDWSGRIGHTEFEVSAPAKGKVEFKLDGSVLPDNSAEYLMTFALQAFQDAYAGAESLVDATARWAKKMDAVKDGTIGSRGGGEGMSDEELAQIYVAKAAYIEAKGKDDWKALDDDAQESAVANVIHKNGEKEWFTDAVARRVAEVVEARKRRAAEKAGLKSVKVDIDL